MPSDATGPAARLAVALPPLDERARRRARDLGWQLDLLDPRDPDERAVLIRLAHPDHDDAIDDGRETIEVDGRETNPRLHLTIHEVVATQIVDDDPPEAFVAAQRLLALGHDHHEVLHMLGFVVSGSIWSVMHDRREYDRAEHVRALDALPGSLHDAVPARPNRAARRAQARRDRRRGGR